LTDSHDPPANSSAQNRPQNESQAQAPTPSAKEEPSSPKLDGEASKKEAELSQVIEQVSVAPVGEGKLGMYFFVRFSYLIIWHYH